MANTCNFYTFYVCPNSRCIYLQCIAQTTLSPTPSHLWVPTEWLYCQQAHCRCWFTVKCSKAGLTRPQWLVVGERAFLADVYIQQFKALLASNSAGEWAQCRFSFAWIAGPIAEKPRTINCGIPSTSTFNGQKESMHNGGRGGIISTPQLTFALVDYHHGFCHPISQRRQFHRHSSLDDHVEKLCVTPTKAIRVCK